MNAALTLLNTLNLPDTSSNPNPMRVAAWEGLEKLRQQPDDPTTWNNVAFALDQLREPQAAAAARAFADPSFTGEPPPPTAEATTPSTDGKLALDLAKSLNLTLQAPPASMNRQQWINLVASSPPDYSAGLMLEWVHANPTDAAAWNDLSSVLARINRPDLANQASAQANAQTGAVEAAIAARGQVAVSIGNGLNMGIGYPGTNTTRDEFTAIAATRSPIDRVGMLLEWVHANPNDAAMWNTIGDQLAAMNRPDLASVARAQAALPPV